MKLIDKIYKQEVNLDEGNPSLVISDLDKERFSDILHNTYLFESDFRYPIVKDKIIMVFKNLGLMGKDTILLDNMNVFKSRFNKNNMGRVSFNYSVNFDNYGDIDNVITYYHNGELFNGNDKDAYRAGIKIRDKKTSLYYSLSYSSINMFKYEIKLDNNVILSREFSKDCVFFIFEGIDKRFIIKINRKVPKNNNSYYVLDNEDKVLEYLISLDSYNIDEIINKLCEISLGNDLSDISEITLCESKMENDRWKDRNLLVLRKGRLYELIKSEHDKIVYIDEDGNFKYVKLDDDVKFSIKGDDVISYNIEGVSDIYSDLYIGNLLDHNIKCACDEVYDIKSKVLERYNVNRNR